MHKFMKAMAVVAGLFTLTACAGSDALNATKTAFTVYTDVYQPSVIFYGTLPDCSETVVICKDRAVLEKMKAYDALAVKAMVLANEAIQAGRTDGTVITEGIEAVAEAQVVIAPAVAVKNEVVE